MRGHYYLLGSRLAARERALDVALKERGERLYRRPFRMLRSEHLHTIERESELGIHWLFGPQSTIFVEGGYPVACRYKIGGPLLRHALDERHDGLFGCFIVPRWELVACGLLRSCGAWN